MQKSVKMHHGKAGWWVQFDQDQIREKTEEKFKKKKKKKQINN